MIFCALLVHVILLRRGALLCSDGASAAGRLPFVCMWVWRLRVIRMHVCCSRSVACTMKRGGQVYRASGGRHSMQEGIPWQPVFLVAVEF
jgi:hypothetical protein